ncbi:hypothetical protein ACFX13_000667 [Malus domestica]
MNVIADNLALAGQPVSDEELVQIVLNNLGPAFEMTVSASQARDTPITYPTLESLLLTTEQRLRNTMSLWLKALLSMPLWLHEDVLVVALVVEDEVTPQTVVQLREQPSQHQSSIEQPR